MAKTISKLGFYFLFFHLTVANAFTTQFSCENCKESISVPLVASNFFVPEWMYLLLLFALVLYILKTVRSFKNGPQPRDYVIFFIFFILLGAAFISSYLDNVQKENFAGHYAFKDKKLSFVIKNKKLFNDQNSQVELIGSYLYDEQNNLYILRSDSNYYVVDFKKNTVHLLKKYYK